MCVDLGDRRVCNPSIPSVRVHHFAESADATLCRTRKETSNVEPGQGLQNKAPLEILEGFWVCGRVCGDRSVFVTSHRPAHTSRAQVFQPCSNFALRI